MFAQDASVPMDERSYFFICPPPNIGNSLFTGTQNEQGELENRPQRPLKKQGTPREQGGRLPLKRLKSNQEKAVRGIPIKSTQSSLVIATPRTQKCTFCGLTGHRKGNASCKAFTALKAQFISHQDYFANWHNKLGDPRLHLVDTPSATQIKSMQNVDWQATIPREVHHVVLLKCYYSREHLEYQTRKWSRYRDMDRQHFSPPSLEDNVMQVIFLCEGAVEYQQDTQPCFMLVSTVKGWISHNCKKTSNKYIISRLQQAHFTNTNNTY
jgi:hypothetical protein